MLYRPYRFEEAPPRLGLHQDMARDAEASRDWQGQEHRCLQLCYQELGEAAQ